MKHFLVVPAIDPVNTDACLHTLSTEALRRVILIDNTDDGRIVDRWDDRIFASHVMGENIGVAASWNRGCRVAFDRGARFATLTSCSMRFADGGDALCRTADFAADHRQWQYGFESLNGWHLFTLGHKTWSTVGEFDEAFHPAYFEDNDYIWRMRQAGILEPVGGDRSTRRIPWVPTLEYDCVGNAMAVKACDIKIDNADLLAYYARKWGGEPGHEVFSSPFDLDHIAQRDTASGATRDWVDYRGDMEYPIAGGRT